jgi:hypothetical protein
MTGSTGTKKKLTMSSLKKMALITAGVLVLYAVAGFIVVPPILKSTLERTISDTLGVTATVADIAVNPFALSCAVRGFSMESGGKTMSRFDELYVNFQISSLFRRAYTFSTVRLTGPEMRVEILPDGSLNWLTLIPEGKDQPSQDRQDKGIIPLLIYQLEIEKGRLNFADLSRTVPFETHLFPIDVALAHFSTQRDRDGRFSVAATLGKGGEVDWKGSMSINPVRSQGTVSIHRAMLPPLWEYFSDRFNFEVTGGSLDITAAYTVDAGTDTLKYKLQDGILEIREFVLSEKGGEHALVSIPLVACRGVEVKSDRQEVAVASIMSTGGSIVGWRNRDGTINYEQLLQWSPGREVKRPVSPSEEGPGEPQEWVVGIEGLSLEKYGITLEDRMPDNPVRVSLAPVSLNIQNLTNRSGVQSDLFLSAGINRTGAAEVKGTAGMNPLVADLSVKVSGVALKDFQPYVAPFAKVELVKGRAGIDGTLKYGKKEDGVPSIRYRGNARVEGLHLDDMLRREDLLAWKSLELSGMDISVAPTKASIDTIVFTEPYARVIIFSDGTVNLGHVFANRDGGEKAVTAPSPSDVTQKEENDGGPPVPISIGEVRIADGSVNFADLSLTPTFAAGIHDLKGDVKGLSSNPSARADVDFSGAVDRHAPVKVKGKINPLSPVKFADVELSFKNMELTSLTPYSGKFAGYAIEKGKLSLDLDYVLEGNRLVGRNNIFLNQFTLGERVESPSATSLPVSLAIALLKDRKGNITIDLPVQGDIDDPEFSYGGLVLSALVNLITKIVTAPFAALGSLLGGQGEELSHIDFEFGTTEIETEEMEKLDRLATALYERPSLRLEIRGVADRTSDRSALAQRSVMMMLRELKAEELEESPSVDEITLSDEDHVRLVTKAYRNLRNTKPELPPPAKKITEAEVQRMTSELIDAVDIKDSDLRQLAHERARQIKGYLIGKGTVENERVFILDVRIEDETENDNARTTLSLS